MYLKAEYLDAVYLQQDAYHDVDAATSADRQKYMFNHIHGVLKTQTSFEEKDAARQFFQKLTQLTKDWNRVPQDSPDFKNLETRAEEMLAEVTAHA